MELTTAKTFVAGLKDPVGKDAGEKNQARVNTFLDCLSLWSLDLAKEPETVRAMTAELQQHYFQSNSGAFDLARKLRNRLEGAQRTVAYKVKNEMATAVLAEIAALMCRSLDLATQIGHIAGSNLEIAFWVAQQIYLRDPMVAARLMRACGKGMSGPFVDEFFWRLKETERPGSTNEWALRAYSEGRLTAEGAANILADYLNRQGQGPEVSTKKADEVRAIQEKHRARSSQT